MEVGFMVALAVLGSIGLYMIGVIVKMTRDDRDQAKVQGLLADGDLKGWARRMGFEVSGVSEPAHGVDDLEAMTEMMRSGRARTKRRVWVASARGARVVIVCYFDSFEVLGEGGPHPMRFTGDLGARVPEGFAMRHAWEVSRGKASYGGEPMSEYVMPGLASQPFEVEGERAAVLALIEVGFFVKLLDLCDGIGFDVAAPRIEGGQLDVIVHDASFLLDEGADARVNAILDGVEAFLEGVHERLEVRASLVRLAKGHLPELAGRRWEAVEALADRYPETLEGLAQSFEELSPMTKAGLARWGAPHGVELDARTRYRALRDVREREGLGIMALLKERYRWHLLIDESIDTYIRMESARDALDASDAPAEADARDASLVRMFGSRVSKARMTLALVFDDLVKAGWEPAPQAARELVLGTELFVQEALLRHIERRGARPTDAPALDALVAHGVRGAAELLESLDLDEMQGTLSLAEGGTARGGLSQAGARGGLTDAGEGGDG